MKSQPKPHFLIIGGDSCIAKYLIHEVSQLGISFIQTTRRLEKAVDGSIFLDLTDFESLEFPVTITHAFILIGSVGFKETNDNSSASDLELHQLPKLYEVLMLKGIKIVYISSSSVFGAFYSPPNENSQLFPDTQYARYKSHNEACILTLSESVGHVAEFAIIRITKLLGVEISPLSRWLSDIRANKVINPLSDLSVAPISGNYLAQSIVKIALNCQGGTFHLSSDFQLTYEQIAIELFQRFQISQSLISPKSSGEANVEVLFRSPCAILDMSRTSVLTGILPQTFDSFFGSFELPYPSKDFSS